MATKIKRTTDEVIAYLLQSKKEMQDEIKKDVDSKEFQEALKKLRTRTDAKKHYGVIESFKNLDPNEMQEQLRNEW